MRRRSLLGFTLACGLLCGMAQPAAAATLGGATLPDAYPFEGRNLVLNGIGLRTLTILNVRAYVAGLYVPRKTGDAAAILASKEPRVLLLQFLHSASKSQVDAQYRAGEQKNCGGGGCDPNDLRDFEALVAATPAMAVGDTLTYWFTEGRLRAFHNQRMIGDFRNGDLAYHILAGFIGPTPPSEDLKAALLGR